MGNVARVRQEFVKVPRNVSEDEVAGASVNQAEILSAIRRVQGNVDWIRESMDRLRKQYGGRYVAVRNRRVIDTDKDFEALLARVRKRKDPEAVTIEHISEIEYIWMR